MQTACDLVNKTTVNSFSYFNSTGALKNQGQDFSGYHLLVIYQSNVLGVTQASQDGSGKGRNI